MNDGFQEVLPHNLEVEMTLLSTVFSFRDTIGDILDQLRPEHFYKQIHQIIFQSFLDLNHASEAIDMVTVNDRLQSSRIYKDVGSEAYLARIIQYLPSETNYKSYITILLDNYRRRKLIAIASNLLDKARNSEDIEEVLAASEQEIFSVAEIKQEKMAKPSSKYADEAWNVIANRVQNPHGTVGISSGFKDFDKITQGFREGDMVILGARPSMGKTALSLQFAKNIAIEQKQPLVIYSLEMPGRQLIHRMFSSLARIDGVKLSSGHLSQNDIERLSFAMGKIASSPLYINDFSALTLVDIRNDLRRVQRELVKKSSSLKMVIIDYLQLIHSVKRANNDQERVSELSRGVKGIAREFNVPVICLSQLSRRLEERADKKPMLSDLRESGAIEQDADLVMFLHRSDYYSKEDAEEGKAELILAKNRNGPTGTVDLFFDKQNASFHNYEGERS